MKPLPKAAREVVEVIRQDTPRPNGKIILARRGRDPGDLCLRWYVTKECKNEPTIGLLVCPMGWHMLSLQEAPSKKYDFAGGKCKAASVKAFADWWDSLTFKDAAKAIDLIWPPHA